MTNIPELKVNESLEGKVNVGNVVKIADKFCLVVNLDRFGLTVARRGGLGGLSIALDFYGLNRYCLRKEEPGAFRPICSGDKEYLLYDKMLKEVGIYPEENY